MKKNEEVTLKQKNIIIRMNTQYPLVDLCDEIEKQTSGKFAFNNLIDIVNSNYTNISSEDRQLFISNIGLAEINVDLNRPYITLLNLFNYFSRIIGYRIISPILSLYYIANRFDQTIKMSTIDFIQKQGFTVNLEININEFSTKITGPLRLDDLTTIILFKALDYNRRGLIDIEEFVLVIDSYREDNKTMNCLNQKEKQTQLFAQIIYKNYISVKEAFSKNCDDNERAQYSLILMEILSKKSKKDGYDDLISSVLESIKDHNNNLTYDDLKELLLENKAQPLKHTIALANSQIHWLNKYLTILNEIKIKPKDVFESCLKPNMNKINLNNLHNQLQVIIPEKYITSLELNHIIESLDISQTMIIDYSEYSMLLQEAVNAKKTNIISEEELKSLIINDQRKKINYLLLPIKGNMKILIKQKNELLFNIMLNKKSKVEESKNKLFAKTTQMQKPLNDQSKEMSINRKDIEDHKSTLSEKSKQTYNFTIIDYQDYLDEYKLIYLIESIHLRTPIITCGEVVNHFVTKGKLEKQKAYNLIKLIDKDNDGFISGKDILQFLLYYIQHRSTIILIKYIFAVLSCELTMTPDEWLTSKKINQTDIIHKDKFTKMLLDSFEIEIPIGKMLYEQIENSNTEPIIYSMFTVLFNQFYINDYNETENFNDEVISPWSMVQIDMKEFEAQIKKIINNLVNFDVQDYSLRQKSFRENLITVLGKNDKNDLLFHEYISWFVKPFYLDINCSQTIFSILKRKSDDNKENDIIRQNDLYNFLSSFIEPIEFQSKKHDDLINQFESIGPSINITLENLPFNKEGGLPVIELMQIFLKFYPTIRKETIRLLLSYLDDDQNGFITYLSIQKLINDKGLFSFKIESMNIISQIIKRGFLFAEDYFQKEDFTSLVSDYSKITKENHDLVIKNLCTSDTNSNELFDYLCTIQNRKESYDLLKYIIHLNCYCYQMNNQSINNSYCSNNYSGSSLSSKRVVENMLSNIKITSFEKISIKDIFDLIEDANQASYFISKIDPDKKGIIAFTDLIEKIKSLFGNEINLPIHLLAQYTYQELIGDNSISNWILKQSNQESLNTYLTQKEFYSIFKESFLNDDHSYFQFYQNNMESLGQYYGLIKLNSFAAFIMQNNIINERSNSISEEDEKMKSKSKKNRSNKSSICSSPQVHDNSSYLNRDESSKSINKNQKQFSRNNSDSYRSSSKSLQIIAKDKPSNIKKRTDVPYANSYNILIEFEDNHLPIKNIIEMIDAKSSNLLNDFSIRKEYIKGLLTSKLSFKTEDADIILSDFTFKEDYNRFDLKLFSSFVSQYFEKSMVDVKNILAKFKRFILISIETDKNSFITNNFGKNVLKFIEVVTLFKQMNITLYECFIIISDNNTINLTSFLSDNRIDELFSSKSFDPKLQSSLRKLKDYFGSVSNRDRLFKKIDLNNDGKLTPNEFIQAIKKFKGLSLSENQVMSIIRVIDIDQDGEINPAEFINFLEVLKLTDASNDKNQHFPVMNDNKKSQNKFVSSILTDISIIKENLNINQQALLDNKSNLFLNYLVIMQQDLIRNFFNQECIENNFKKYNQKKDFLITNDAFLICLKEKLLSIDTTLFTKFKHISEEGLTQSEKSNNIINEKINYKRFLINLANYNYYENTQRNK